VPLASTTHYGDLFEQFVINEFVRMDSYLKTQCRFSFLRTADDVEIDLVIERPNRPLAFVEIKSAPEVQDRHLKGLSSFLDNFPKAEFYCLSNDLRPKRMGRINCLHWLEGLSRILE
jgi:predicted AAA+ superfamily ATPase